MKGRNLTITQCVETLFAKMAVVDDRKKEVDISKARNLGNKSWGMIDFLCNHHHYFLSGKREYENRK